jgi:hypothetical protein
MKTKVIYLQSSFWKQLQSDTSIAGLQCMMNVYEAVSDANLRTDIEDDIWDSDPFLKLLWKKYLSSQTDIELYESISIEKPEENAEDLAAVYLLNDNDSSTKCEDLSVQYGVVAINSIDIPHKEYLFKGDGFLLEKNRLFYEDRFLQFKSKICYPCNSMILIDPYLLSNEQKIENNLYYLLDAILPNRKLHVVFQLAIFSMLGKDNTDASNGEKYYNNIVNLIRATRKGLNFVLSLYAIGKAEEFHRRMIITNNVFFSADDGFDVFKNDGTASKNATFNIVLPRLVGNYRQDMSNYLRWIKIAKERSRKQYKTQVWGPRDNRLFDLIQ